MLVSAVPKILLRNIVVATDFSSASEVALTYAHAIARHYTSKLLLVHAMPIVHAPQSEGLEVPPTELLADAELSLRAEAEKCADVDCQTRLVTGTALEVVEQILSLDHIDLIVVGTHGTRGFRRFLLGSAAEQIFRHVRCPVLVVGPSVAATHTRWQPKRILLATDLESDETKTIEYATSFAAEHNAELALLHITPPAAAPFPEDTETFLRPYFQSRLRLLIPSWPEPNYPARFLVEFGGDPVTETIRVVSEQGIDLVVLSVHPGTPWTTHFQHDAHGMVAEAPCPVLVVQRRF